METNNAKSAFTHGALLTDTIAQWVKNKMVAGPFDEPPLANFRVNPLMAVQQKTKVRPILNLSAPKKFSFNDAVDESHVRKLEMSSASLFAKALRKAGKGAIMAKYDICDAYKQIAGHPSQWAAFGFRWLGKYFYDITTVFGSKSAPANFDMVLKTIVNIVITLTGVPRSIVHRQLDDVPLVSPVRPISCRFLMKNMLKCVKRWDCHWLSNVHCAKNPLDQVRLELCSESILTRLP